MDFIINKNVPVPAEYSKYSYLAGGIPVDIYEELNRNVKPDKLTIGFYAQVYSNLKHTKNKLQNCGEIRPNTLSFNYDGKRGRYIINSKHFCTPDELYAHPMHPIYMSRFLPHDISWQSEPGVSSSPANVNLKSVIDELDNREKRYLLNNLSTYLRWCEIYGTTLSLAGAVVTDNSIHRDDFDAMSVDDGDDNQ